MATLCFLEPTESNSVGLSQGKGMEESAPKEGAMGGGRGRRGGLLADEEWSSLMELVVGVPLPCSVQRELLQGAPREGAPGPQAHKDSAPQAWHWCWPHSKDRVNCSVVCAGKRGLGEAK